VGTASLVLRRRFTLAMTIVGLGAGLVFATVARILESEYLVWSAGSFVLGLVGIGQLVSGRHSPSAYVVVAAAMVSLTGQMGLDDFPVLLVVAALFATSVVFVVESRREVVVALGSMFLGLLVASVVHARSTGGEVLADLVVNALILGFGFGFAWTVNEVVAAQGDRAQAMYRALFESVGDAVATVDLDGTILFANREFSAMFEVDRRELAGTSFSYFVAPRERDRWAQILARLRHQEEAEREPTRIVVTGVTAVGEARSLEIGVTLVEVRDEPMVALVIRDLTARLRAEEHARRLLDQYRDLYEGVPVGLYRTAADGELLECNAALAEILGYRNSAELVGVNVADLYVDPADREELLDAVTTGRSVAPFRLLRRDGTLIWARVRARPLRAETGEVVGIEGTLEDVTAEMEASRDVEASFRFRRGLVGWVAHVLRTPLTGILGFASILRSQLTGEAAETAGLILCQARELAVTIDDFVTAARLEGGDRVTIIPRAVRIRPVLDEVADALEEMGYPRPTVDGPPDLVARCDALRLGQALRMLARDRLQQGARSLRLHAGSDGAAVVVELEDRGPRAPGGTVASFLDPSGGVGPVGRWTASRLLVMMGARMDEQGSEGTHRYRVELPAVAGSGEEELLESAGGDGHPHQPHGHEERDVADEAPVEHPEGEGAQDLDAVVER